MSRRTLRAGLLLPFLALSCVCGQSAGPGLGVDRRIEVPFVVSDFRISDLEGDGRDELVVIGVEGEVRVFRESEAEGGGLGSRGLGTLELSHPDFSIASLAAASGPGSPLELVIASLDGIRSHAPKAGGGFADEGRLMTPRRGRRRARFDLRVGAPRFVSICDDVNQDGLTDVILPRADSCELWLQKKPGEKGARMRRAARLSVSVRRSGSRKSERLSDELESSFVIPGLRVQDVNGDGLDDVIVQDGRTISWYRQRAGQELPSEPDRTLNLRIFRDTTPEASIRPGRILAGQKRQVMQTRDLDADGIPDYVIAHRRKIWVFMGTKDGPSFERPTQILKSAEDVTTLLLARLDDDPHPDLVVLKVEVPSIAGLLFGALGDISVDVSSVGYRSKGQGGFDPKPAWRNSLTIELPSIVSILRNPYAIIRRFEEATAKSEGIDSGDLDADGRPEILRLDATERSLALWRGKKPASDLTDEGSDDMVREVLFDDENRTWDLDRIVSLIQRLSEGRIARQTGARDPDATTEVRADATHRLLGYGLGDWSGDGRSQVCVLTVPRGESRTLIDLFSLR